jgi:hypothetical protein
MQRQALEAAELLDSRQDWACCMNGTLNPSGWSRGVQAPLLPSPWASRTPSPGTKMGEEPVDDRITMGCDYNPALCLLKEPVLVRCKESRGEFFIFILSRFCKNIWSVTNFAKKYICRRGPWRQDHNAVAHGVRSCQEWALNPNAMGHGITSLTSWPAALGA